MTLFFSSFSSLVLLYTVFLNNNIVLIIQSSLSTAQASTSFTWLDIRTSASTTPTFITEALCLVTQLQVFLNDCYSELTAYAMLAHSCWDSFLDMYGCLRYAH